MKAIEIKIATYSVCASVNNSLSRHLLKLFDAEKANARSASIKEYLKKYLQESLYLCSLLNKRLDRFNALLLQLLAD